MKPKPTFKLDLPVKSSKASKPSEREVPKIELGPLPKKRKMKEVILDGTDADFFDTVARYEDDPDTTGPQNVIFHKDEVMPMPTDAQVAEAKALEPVTNQAMADMKKQLQVTIEYNQSILGHPWMLLMECIEDRIEHLCRESPKNKDADYWFNTLNNLGAMPFRTLVKSTQVFFMALYAAAYIHHNGLWDSDADKRNQGPPTWNPDWDPNEANEKQDGKHWGLKLDLTSKLYPPKPAVSDILVSSKEAMERSKEVLDRSRASRVVTPPTPEVPTVREQVEQKQATDLKAYVMAENERKGLERIREAAEDPYTQKWRIAEQLAHGPRERWDNDTMPFELREMVAYCYGWLQDTGEVPEYPNSIIEIWWSRPTRSVINLTPAAVARRDAVVEKVRQFWNKSVAASPADKIQIHSESYRVTLAAMQLEKLIEEYANGTENEMDIKKAALKYFHAHFSIESLGVKPGPIGTLDPSFPDYVKLCQKYNLSLGTLLHEASL
jgi:hypothetical protein